jgi:hypothetical protein
MSPRISCSALLVALAASGCTRDEPAESSRPPEGPLTVAMWDFPEEPVAKSVSLWPPRAGAPRRSKRHLGTRDDHDRLDAVVEGADPFFMWRFETPILVWSVGVQADLAGPGQLQLFWSTARCPVFSEQCSTTRSLPRGPSHVTFFLDRTDPVRELRLDLPDQLGARVAFDAITVREDARVGSPWIAPGTETPEPELTPLGLRVQALEADPWILTSLTDLDTSRVDTVELTLRGPSGPPQLYWDAACGSQGFSEECSARFAPVDAGALTHRLDLASVPRWRGHISTLRLDPSPDAGTYFIERIALIKTAPR